MRRPNKVGLGLITTLFCAASIAACSASGNDVAGNPTGGGTAGDGGAVTDSSYGADASQSSDSGSGTDSGKATGIDSGVIDDAGVIFTGGGTCDITDGLTVTVEELITFIGTANPASCDSSTPCDSSHCCLDLTAASGGGGVGLPSGGICLTQIDLSSLGL